MSKASFEIFFKKDVDSGQIYPSGVGCLYMNDQSQIPPIVRYGSGVWFEALGNEWVVLISDFAADLYKCTYYANGNGMMMEKFNSTYVHPDEINDDVVARLISKVLPRNTESQ